MTVEDKKEIETNPADQESQVLRYLSDEASRRLVMFMMMMGVLWLVGSSFLGFCASVKSHASGLLATETFAFLHYGRLKPAFQTAFLYGWCFNAGLAVAYWLQARLCKVGIVNKKWITLGVVLWNVLVLIATKSIMMGGNQSYEWLAFPDWLWLPMLIAFVVIAIGPIILYQIRRPGTSFVSELYILGACIWFPLLFLATNILIRHSGDTGVIGPATNAWYINGVMFLFILPIGLGSLYYILPKITGKPIYSYHLARVGFWSLAVLAGWSGLQKYLGGPYSQTTLLISSISGMLLLIPIILSGANHHLSTKGFHGRFIDSPTLRFSMYGGFCLTAFGVIWFLFSMPWLSGILQFTVAQEGAQLLCLYGFFTMVMFGAFYFIVPRLVRCEWPSPRMINIHFWVSNWGVLFMVGLLLVGGYLQGEASGMSYQYERIEGHPEGARPEGFVNWERDFYSSLSIVAFVKRSISFTWLLLTAANLVFLLHMLLMVLRLGRKSASPTLLIHEGGGH